MKLCLSALLGLVPLALAAESLRSVVITYPAGTPEEVMDQAKDSLVAAGGVITHEFHLINGFSAEAPTNALQTLSTESTTYKPEIEEDKVVTISGDYEGEEHSDF